MDLPDPQNLTEVLTELREVRQRLAELESRAERRKGPPRARLFAIVAVAALFGAGVASAANGACPNGLPVCFAQNTPALASDVNLNFATLKEWLETKVGQVDAGVIIAAPARIQTGSTSNASAAVGHGLFVSSVSGDGSNNANGIVEFRHDNLTQGIGIGWNTIYTAGPSASDLNLKPMGTGVVNVMGDLNVTSNAWSSPGPASVTPLNRTPCAQADSTQCPPGQYVCGLTFNHACGSNWWEETVALQCCGL
jgi:hypothetical protein